MIFLVFYLFAALHLAPQSNAEPVVYPQGYFKSPLDLQLTLAGNFGEPRKGHFHTGLDLKTNSEEGHAVFAAADGYVSRINVSPYGYGNALYITHPNGYTTVYGHLREFSKALTELARKEQYEKQSFSVDLFLKPGEFVVKQGDKVALSGNTGGSGGPHLHFEIRDSAEHAINPMLFGFKLKDQLPPKVSELKLYPMDGLKYKCDGYRTKLFAGDSSYEVTGGIIKLNTTSVGIAVNTHDVMDLTDNTVGVYNMKLYNDGKLVYQYQMDKISFTDTRYVLTQVDYPVFLKESQKSFQKCFVEPGNHCPIYNNLSERGIIDLADNKAHDIRIEVSDFAGNTSVIRLKVRHENASTLLKDKELTYTTMFEYEKENEYSNADIKLKLPLFCLFDNAYFNYSSALATNSEVFSKVHVVGKGETEIFNWFNISIKPERLNTKLHDKALVIYRDDNNIEVARGGKYEDGFVTTRAREFGTYYLRVDTTAPYIAPVNITAGKNMKATKKILVKISDNLSGISDFDTYIDDKWVLTSYDAKSATLTHLLDSGLTPGTHSYKVVVTDERKNVAEYSVKFKM